MVCCVRNFFYRHLIVVQLPRCKELRSPPAALFNRRTLLTRALRLRPLPLLVLTSDTLHLFYQRSSPHRTGFSMPCVFRLFQFSYILYLLNWFDISCAKLYAVQVPHLNTITVLGYSNNFYNNNNNNDNNNKLVIRTISANALS